MQPMSSIRQAYLQRVLDGKVSCFTSEEYQEALEMRAVLESGEIPQAAWKSELHHQIILKAMAAGSGG